MSQTPAKTATQPVILKEPSATEGSRGILRYAQNDSGEENDRLAHAIKHAAKLNDSRLWKIKISYLKRWTPLRRARKAVEIQYTKPWRHAKGPKGDPSMNMVREGLRLHSRFLVRLNIIRRMAQNGLSIPKRLLIECKRDGEDAYRALLLGLTLDGYVPCNRAQQ